MSMRFALALMFSVSGLLLVLGAHCSICAYTNGHRTGRTVNNPSAIMLWNYIELLVSRAPDGKKYRNMGHCAAAQAGLGIPHAREPLSTARCHARRRNVCRTGLAGFA